MLWGLKCLQDSGEKMEGREKGIEGGREEERETS